jgi:hypothetical protein
MAFLNLDSNFAADPNFDLGRLLGILVMTLYVTIQWDMVASKMRIHNLERSLEKLRYK